MFAHLTIKSNNRKVGKIPVSTTGKQSCPSSCPLFNNGCYANLYPLSLHWARVSDGRRGTDFKSFCNQIKSLPKGTFWRHNQAGDLIGKDNKINKTALKQLVNANTGKLGFTYTHYPPTRKHNLEAIKYANKNGFTVNISANSASEADKYFGAGLPTTVIVSGKSFEYDKSTRHFTGPKSLKSPDGQTIMTCPAQLHEHITCDSCRICQKADRKFIVGFIPHGKSYRKVEKHVQDNLPTNR